ncbi:DUF2778 domain-containing protein [Tardiphaga sp. vice154]|uniref:DUF2778 domain-containing protein n=1 Tax=Tardiphaga sp. vice154 TaxID=2592814 RepID=UPI0011620577|nr:DUF2778 domain-containing protein [Tardiphaga sp. vice154]QDM20396.1 DUF2778 domain-containing protein [Tardiphaga sp. vice154]
MDVAQQTRAYGRRQRPIALARASLLGAAVLVAAVAAALAPDWLSTPTPAVAPQATPQRIAFALRYPDELVLDQQREAGLRRARAQLAEQLRGTTMPSATEAPSIAPDPGPKVPIPRSRPPIAGAIADGGRLAAQPMTGGSFDVSSAVRNVFAMLPPGLQLASINPDGGLLGNGQEKPVDLSAYGEQTAVYDITARVVHMPDGTRLEAHSGFGDLMDDVDNVHVRDRGATPPNVYELSLREKLFHGVQALRMKPVGEGELFGRNGLLAHSYLLGPNGQSNGCVSFKDYDAFLKAYHSGDIKRLVVVKSIRDDTTRLARKT